MNDFYKVERFNIESNNIGWIILKYLHCCTVKKGRKFNLVEGKVRCTFQ